MGMFDVIYSELTCPFCGHEYKYSPPSYEKAKADLDGWRKSADETVANKDSFAYKMWYAGLSEEEIQAKLQGMNSDDAIQTYINKKVWGLCEVQTKEFECLMSDYFIGDLVEYAHYGKYYVAEGFACNGCRTVDNQHIGRVGCWIEIDEHRITKVLTFNPETGKAERYNWKTRETEYK